MEVPGVDAPPVVGCGVLLGIVGVDVGVGGRCSCSIVHLASFAWPSALMGGAGFGPGLIAAARSVWSASRSSAAVRRWMRASGGARYTAGRVGTEQAREVARPPQDRLPVPRSSVALNGDEVPGAGSASGGRQSGRATSSGG